MASRMLIFGTDTDLLAYANHQSGTGTVELISVPEEIREVVIDSAKPFPQETTLFHVGRERDLTAFERQLTIRGRTPQRVKVRIFEVMKGIQSFTAAVVRD